MEREKGGREEKRGEGEWREEERTKTKEKKREKEKERKGGKKENRARIPEIDTYVGGYLRSGTC